MAKKRRQLVLTIEQQGKKFHHRLGKDEFTVGKHPANDITIRSEEYPSKHVLFARKNNHFQLRFQSFMKGEVIAEDSRLSFEDMVAHGLLGVRDDSYTYPITGEKTGHVYIGDAKISFRMVTEEVTEVAPDLRSFTGYSWTRATLKNLVTDLPFKGLVLSLVIMSFFLMNYISKIERAPGARLITPNVPERFARIIVKNPPPVSGSEARRVAAAQQETEEAEATPDEPRRNASEKGPETVRPQHQGVLGLLTGTGNTQQSSSVTDFLLDKGLARELDDVMSATTLDIGKGTNDGDLDLDALIATSELGGGIDDIVEDVTEVETVQLEEKGQIQVDQIGGMTGSADALGKRSEDSVRGILMQYTGRLTYIYNKHLKRDPDLRGKMVVEVEIAADGSVSDVRILSSNLNNHEFEQEVIAFVRRWRYEPIDQGTVSVNYPLFFSKVM